MLRTVPPPGSGHHGDRAESLTVFTVLYGQHSIGLARARDGHQAVKLIEAFFLGDIEPERMTARAATPEERATFFRMLAEADKDLAVGLPL